MKRIHQESGLLELTEQRFKELGLGDGLPYRVPDHDPRSIDRIEHAIRLHADANRSDPFAAGRIRLHLIRGIESAGDVIKAATAAIAARRAQHVGEWV